MGLTTGARKDGSDLFSDLSSPARPAQPLASRPSIDDCSSLAVQATHPAPERHEPPATLE